MTSPDFQVSLGLSLPALRLVMEGLEGLPLGRVKYLYDSIEAEAARQAKAFEDQQKAASAPPPAEAPPAPAEAAPAA